MKKEIIDKEINLFKNELKKIKNLEELKLLKSRFLNKSNLLNELRVSIKKSLDKEKQEVGKLIKYYTNIVIPLIENKKNYLENKSLIVERDNLLLKDTNFKLIEKNGGIHPLTKVSLEVENYFDSMNFSYSHGVEVDSEENNFDILNLPSNHPAREMQDTFFLEGGMVLRTHSTNETSKSLKNSRKSILKSYSIGPVFRNDENDSTHSFQFNQIDFFGIGNYSLANLKLVIEGLIKKIFSNDIKSFFRPSFFPFTEPSYEVDIECQNCKGKGCNICSNTGFIEILGSGMLHYKVIKNVGKDFEKLSGFAAGIGVERIAMIKWKINDIRSFFINDLDFLKNYFNLKK